MIFEYNSLANSLDTYAIMAMQRIHNLPVLEGTISAVEAHELLQYLNSITNNNSNKKPFKLVNTYGTSFTFEPWRYGTYTATGGTGGTGVYRTIAASTTNY